MFEILLLRYLEVIVMFFSVQTNAVWYIYIALTHSNYSAIRSKTSSGGGSNPANESAAARPSLETAYASPTKKDNTAAASPSIKNMKGSDYNALIKAKNAGSSASFKKKKDYNDLVKEKKAQAKAAALAQQ